MSKRVAEAFSILSLSKGSFGIRKEWQAGSLPYSEESGAVKLVQKFNHP
jgi:hypothetical protein